jgi:hypothetical protein
VRGMVCFALEKIQLPSSRTRYVNRVIRLLMRFIKIKYELRPGYRDPVLASNHKQLSPASRWTPDATNLSGNESL